MWDVNVLRHLILRNDGILETEDISQNVFEKYYLIQNFHNNLKFLML